MKVPPQEEKIMQEIDYLREKYFTFNLPIPFCGLELYPVNIKEYTEFMTSSSCLLLNKNDDFEGIKKTHLEYLLSKMSNGEEGRIWALKLSRLIELCFHVPPGLKCHECGAYLSYGDYIQKCQEKQIDPSAESSRKCECGRYFTDSLKYSVDKEKNEVDLIIDGNHVSSSDFNRLRKIILYQNLPDFKDDSWVDKSIRDDQAERSEILSRDHGKASLEKKISALCVGLGYTIDQVYQLSMRQFLMLFSTMNDFVEYRINRQALASGFVKLEKGKSIDHWIYQKEQGLYQPAVDVDALKQKVNSM